MKYRWAGFTTVPLMGNIWGGQKCGKIDCEIGWWTGLQALKEAGRVLRKKKKKLPASGIKVPKKIPRIPNTGIAADEFRARADPNQIWVNPNFGIHMQ